MAASWPLHIGSTAALTVAARLSARRRCGCGLPVIPFDRTLTSLRTPAIRTAPRRSSSFLSDRLAARAARVAAAMSGTSALLALAKQTPYTWTDDKQHVQIGNVTLHRQTKVPYR